MGLLKVFRGLFDFFCVDGRRGQSVKVKPKQELQKRRVISFIPGFFLRQTKKPWIFIFF
jgi:hypothetical protein